MVGATIELQGLDANWDAVTQTADLVAPTTVVVTLSTPLIRCFRMKVLADVVGDSEIRCHNVGETQDYAIISIGANQTQMAVYTIPNGKTGYMTNYWSHHNPATGLDPTSNPIEVWASDRDGPYAAQLKHGVGLPTNGGFRHPFNPYLGPFTQKTDIFITSAPVGKDANVSAGFDIILEDN
jgi:hypothetical protein